MLNKKILAAGLSFMLLSTAAGCRSIENHDSAAAAKIAELQAATTENKAGMDGNAAPEEATIATVKKNGGDIRVIAAGDNMIQTAVCTSASVNASGSAVYDFRYCYDGVKDIISKGDLNIINQETLICDNPNIEISGTRGNFNSPAEVGDALMELGFNAISMGNDHVLDKGEGGLESCLDYWDEMINANSGLTVYGAYKNIEDMNNIRLHEVNGLTVALLAYTESTNGNSVSEDSELRIVYTYETELIKEQIETANEIADVVIVSAHWGTEDSLEPAEGTKNLAKDMVNWGADVILGTNPHVPQTMEYLTREDGSQGFVFYSLGNFISSQSYNINLIGEIADFNISVDAMGEVKIEDIKVIPVITQYDDGYLSNVRLIPYSQYTEALCEDHGLPQAVYDPLYAEWNMERIKEIIDAAIPAEFQKLD